MSLCVVALHGCALPDRGPAVPQKLTARAEIPDIEGVRYLPPDDTDRFIRDALAAGERGKAYLEEIGHNGKPPPVHYIALSGGGDNGAFGAGVLVGWSEHGTRPEFRAVTGISTGALLAPFVFAGEEYDDVLRSVYPALEQENVFWPRNILAALFDDALNDTTPLYRTIEQHVDEKLLKKIGEEYQRKGRWLLIATTNLDARRHVIWNMGAIAASDHPDALDLFRRVMLASSSIPGFFPPVMFDVEADGEKYQEMHVDGGAVVQTFFVHSSFASAIRKRGLVSDTEKKLYIIRNARLDAEWASVDRRTLSILGRAITALLNSQGIDDLFRIYLHAKTDGIDFNLAFIGPEFDHEHEEMFDDGYMAALYKYAYELSRKGYPWSKTPPNYSE